MTSEGAGHQTVGKTQKTVVISCESNRPELEKINNITSCHYPFYILDAKYHDRPDKLKQELQSVLNDIRDVDAVLLAMGYCGNALTGIRAGNFRIIIPKVDDCLTLFLGSLEKRQAVENTERTFFLTKGWLDSERNILRQYSSLQKRYGKESAAFVYRTMFEHYEKLGLIDSGLFPVEPQAEKMESVSRLLHLPYEILSGSCDMILSLFINPEDERFIIVRPFEEITRDHFSFIQGI